MYDVIIIGAGQAGLSLGYFLKDTNQSFLIVDKSKEIGESWRTRYDSLTLFTPRTASSLPGLNLEGDERIYPKKDEIADYLATYVSTFKLPVQLGTVITEVAQIENGFKVKTTKGELITKNVVIATGPFQTSFIPTFAENISEQVQQLHSSQYKNPSQLKEGPVLVVGGGNSGAQIAVELSKERDVYLSVSQKLTYLPQDIAGKSIFWWFDKVGILKANLHTKLGAFLKNRPDPIFGFELKDAINKGEVTLKPRTTNIKNNSFHFQDSSQIEVPNVIWSTGFTSNYNWLKTPSIFTEKGNPIHERGITTINGLYFLGLPWQYRRGSALLQGVADDANYIAKHMLMKEG